jgi:DNA primase
MPAMAHPTARTVNVLRGLAEQETARLLAGSRPWTWWLEHAARYGRHGFANTVLIAAQWRFATDVRSYEEWRAAGRQVRRGETGIRIISRNGRSRAVFDVSQTDGLPLEPAGVPLPAACERLRQAAHGFGLRIDHDVPVSRDAVTALALRLGQAALPAHTASVAYLVLAHLGVPGPHLVFPEVRSWAKDTASVAAAGDRILRAARDVIGGLDLAGASRACLDAAHAFFRAQAPASWVPAHLAERGFAPDVLERWEIGYAPGSWRALTEHLRGLGYDDEAILGAGLARRGRRGVLHDVFRDRVMFAVRDGDGAVAGFVGRLAEGADGPRYLGSPESAIFRKSRLPYGLHEARGRLAEGARPVIVEGPFDAVAVNVAVPGHAAVAVCGSTVTAAHLRALRAGRAAGSGAGVLLALDGDQAGRAAAIRAWGVLSGVDAPVDVALLPAGDDPADVLRREGPAALREALAATRPLADLVVDAAVERAGGALRSPEERLAALRASTALIARMAPVHVARQAGRVARRLGLDHATVTSALVEAVTAAEFSPSPAPWPVRGRCR